PTNVGLGFAVGRQARQSARPNRVHSRCGLVVLLRLLPTPCHQDAVTFRYRPESVCLKRTSTSLTKHTCKRTILYLRHPPVPGGPPAEGPRCCPAVLSRDSAPLSETALLPAPPR